MGLVDKRSASVTRPIESTSTLSSWILTVCTGRLGTNSARESSVSAFRAERLGRKFGGKRFGNSGG